MIWLTWRGWALIVVCVVAAVVNSACGGAVRQQEVKPAAGSVAWGACPSNYGPLVQCAQVTVPLDWGDPGGPQISFGVDRLAATGKVEAGSRDWSPTARLGALVFDPGGPGLSGSKVVSIAASADGLFPPEIRERFDLIGFDPRGVGLSTPHMRCDPAMAAAPVNIYPNSESDYAAASAHNRQLSDSCRQLTGALFDHLSTADVVKDLELLRQRLGGGPLNYLGQSYGSAIGQQYTAAFPHTIRAMVLDGVLTHGMPLPEMSFYEAAAMQDSVRRFAHWCRSTPACALVGEDPIQVVDDLVGKASRAPLPVAACSTTSGCPHAVSQADFLESLQEHLMFDQPVPAIPGTGWLVLAAALARAEHGDASDFAADSVTDNMLAGRAVTCADYGSGAIGFAGLAALRALLATVAPDTAGFSTSYEVLGQCQGWNGLYSNPIHDTPSHPDAPVLLVNAVHDPSTSYGWAQSVSADIAGSILLTRDGNGHTSLYQPGPTRDAITRYLVSSVLPAPGTVLPN